MGPAGKDLATPGSAVKLPSVARHVTDCATRSGIGYFLHFIESVSKLILPGLFLSSDLGLGPEIKGVKLTYYYST